MVCVMENDQKVIGENLVVSKHLLNLVKMRKNSQWLVLAANEMRCDLWNNKTLNDLILVHVWLVKIKMGVLTVFFNKKKKFLHITWIWWCWNKDYILCTKGKWKILSMQWPVGSDYKFNYKESIWYMVFTSPCIKLYVRHQFWIDTARCLLSCRWQYTQFWH